MSLLRFAATALLPRVFVAGEPPAATPPPALITARDLSAAIAANAALTTFAHAEAPPPERADHAPFATTPTAGTPAVAVSPPPRRGPDDLPAPGRDVAA